MENTRQEALINPAILGWARTTASMSVPDIARILKCEDEKIESWENGSSPISLASVRKIAKACKIGLAVFYLSEVPIVKNRQLIDRRSIDGIVQPISPDLNFLIRTLEMKQDWLSEQLKETKSPKLNYGRFSIENDIDSIVNDIKSKLNISTQEQIETKEAREAFNLWASKAENFGINVVNKSEGIAIEDFRALVLYDDYAPFICINSKDGHAGRLFSLAHELVHLWIKESVLSNNSTYRSSDKVEVFCNEVAGRMLVDRNLLLDKWNEIDKNLELEAIVKKIARYFSVSNEVIARSLLIIGEIDNDDYIRLRNLYREQWEVFQKNKKKSKGAPPYGLVKVLENGKVFSRAVLNNYDSGNIFGSEASRLLATKINHFGQIKKYLALKVGRYER